jgi:hypothetical protein
MIYYKVDKEIWAFETREQADILFKGYKDLFKRKGNPIIEVKK